MAATAQIDEYLRKHSVPFTRFPHPRAVSAQELAATLHVTGHRVAKSVVIRTPSGYWLAVLPASEEVDLKQLARVLGVGTVDLATEQEFERLFPDCEVGAEPPFGGLYQLPVVMDATLKRWPAIIVRGGTHEAAVEMSAQDYTTLEWPLIGSFTRQHGARAAVEPIAPSPPPAGV